MGTDNFYLRLENYILTRFPNNPSNGFYVYPSLPAKKLGKILMDYTRIKSPAEVKAFYYYSKFIGSYHVVLTNKKAFAKDVEFLLEDVFSAEYEEEMVKIALNQGGSYTTILIKTGKEEHAKVLARFFDGISSIPRTDELVEKALKKTAGLNEDEIRWIELKDEILKTIDQLNELYQAGKITITEFEEAKHKLLSRL